MSGNWTKDLAEGIDNALQKLAPCKVAVHSTYQVEMGKSAAQRMAPQWNAKAEDVTFEMIEKEDRETYPVGTILD
jgi:hypothetical protein